ncbi:3-phosphoshikimate 1-carboxyvinyltransferase [bacterium]|nr:MAG: 3-phosphoshikimate 1-carboxyvinyltransferase [bacterium]
MTWTVSPSGPLSGEITVPGDKSITHRAYLIGAIAEGETVVHKPLKAEDTDNTLQAVRSLGIDTVHNGETVKIMGSGPGGLREPDNILDLGNSGTGVRLLAGLLSGRPFLTVLTGDESLRNRPMMRVATPLKQMGAVIDGRESGTLLPLIVRGGELRSIEYQSPVASAQVKSCVLLAALQATGTTVFQEPSLSRDHTERMLVQMGVNLLKQDDSLVLDGGQVPQGREIMVPGDISSAAFFLAAGAVREDSHVVIKDVGVNPTRTGIVRFLQAMGAEIEILMKRDEGEPVADIAVRGTGNLNGIEVPPDWIPSIIDELPLAAVVAACSRGTTKIRGAGELRVKESDRISTTVRMLQQAGVKVRELKDGLVVEGTRNINSAAFESHGDHRIAMASAILALMADSPSSVSGTGCVATSFKGFPDSLNALSPSAVEIYRGDLSE